MSEFDEQMSKVGKIVAEMYKQNPANYLYEPIRVKLKYILNNDTEYERLIDLFDAAHNRYGRCEEVAILEALSKILLAGLDSKLITSIMSISAYGCAMRLRCSRIPII